MNRLDVLPLAAGGSLLLSAFPGQKGDVERLADNGAGLLISLTTTPEMAALGLPPERLARSCRKRGMAWRHMSVADMGVAGAQALAAWREIGPLAHGLLDAGRAVAIHCRMGLGRTGTLAGIVLVERGLTPEEAVAAIRRARPGSIETRHQEAMIESWTARR